MSKTQAWMGMTEFGIRKGKLMISVSELKNWLETLAEDDFVGVDDGGLCLVVLDTDAYYEIGGMPEEEEN